jgi:hypothetical protein
MCKGVNIIWESWNPNDMNIFTAYKTSTSGTKDNKKAKLEKEHALEKEGERRNH